MVGELLHGGPQEALLPASILVGSPLSHDFGLGHVTYFDQWDFSKNYASRGALAHWGSSSCNVPLGSLSRLRNDKRLMDRDRGT